MKRILHATIIAASIGLWIAAGCSTSPTGSGKANVREMTPLEKQNITQSNTFTFSLFDKVNKAESGKNVFISPLSVSYAFGMVLNGANGNTKQQIDSVLGWSGVSDDDINSSYMTLSKYLVNLDPTVSLSIANSIWYDRKFQVDGNFIQVNGEYFGAEVGMLDFTSPDAVSTINNWVDAKTNHKIPKVLNQIPENEVMYLINAIYFNGTWKYKFDEAGTSDAPFYSSDGTSQDIKLMHAENNLPYYQNSEFQAVELPYGDSLYSMLVVLPREGNSIEQLASEITQSDLQNIDGNVSVQKVDLSLPRFELNYSRQLNDDLKALGIVDAFDAGKADLSRINNANMGLYISDVEHITYLKVDEAGTEAAAVTVVGVGMNAVEPRAITMNVDHPFLLFIHERNSGAILFAGKVVKM